MSEDVRAERKLIRPITLETPEGDITWTGDDAEAFLEAERDTLVNTCFKGKRLEWRHTFYQNLAGKTFKERQAARVSVAVFAKNVEGQTFELKRTNAQRRLLTS